MQQLTTFGTTTLSGSLVTGAASGTFVDGSVFPSTGNFILLVDDEYIVVDSRTGNNFTIATRGYAGTSDVTHSSGTTVKLVLSKEVLLNYFGDSVLTGGYASRPTTGLRAGLLYYATDTDLVWYHDGTNWNLWQPLYVPYANRVDLSGWTQVNAGSSTWTDINGVNAVKIPSNSGDTHRFWWKNLPSAPYTLNTIIERSTASSAFSGGGIGLYDGTKLYTIIDFDNNDIQTMSVDRYTNATTFSSNDYRLNHWYPRVYLRIQDDNTNWKFSYSYDGLNYNQVYQVTRNTFLTATKVILTVDRTETTISGDEYCRFLGYWET